MTQPGILIYRPLRGGISIQNPIVKRPGTIGLVATSNGTDRWIVSCYHVLCRIGSAFPAGVQEPICQPYDLADPHPVAMISDAKIDSNLDCAAALVLGVGATGQIVGIGQLVNPILPVAGMRVIKSGAETGVTEGRILSVVGDEVEIGPVGLPAEYDLSEGGDSGAVWVDAATHAPVALHYKGNDWGTPERAYAKNLLAVLASLQLQTVIDP